MSNILDSHLGVNRLRSGFVTEKKMFRSSSHQCTPSGGEDSLRELTTNNNMYNLTTEDDDGGVTININGETTDPIIISDDDNDFHEQSRNELANNDYTITNETPDLIKQINQQEEGHSGTDARENGARKSEKQSTQPLETNSEMMVVDSIGQNLDPTAIGDSSSMIDVGASTASQVCLKDLNPSQVEDQIRYAFWYLDRHQIDLSRPARCFNCQEDGHIDEVCPLNTCIHCGMYASHKSALCPKALRCEKCRDRGHDKSQCNGLKNITIPCDLCASPEHHEENCPLKYYLPVKANAKAIKLWVSCCVCTSRTHLVGDCPKILSGKAARWSLQSLAPEQVTNLSIQSGIQKLEQEAENRHMRPLGMRIKGRANIHHANATRRDQSDSDDPDFFGYPSISHGGPGRESHRPRTDPRGPRHGTFNAPGRSDMYRPPRNGFYATDSFGRPRSRSPEPFRRRDPRGRRSPSIDGSSTDSYRPAQARDSHPGSLIRQGQKAAPNPARGGLSIQLSTRKSSNTNTQNATVPKKAKLSGKSIHLAQDMISKSTSIEPLTKTQRKKLKRQAQTQAKN